MNSTPSQNNNLRDSNTNGFFRPLSILGALAFAFSLLLAPSNALAQGAAPICHFGTFTIQSSLNRTLNLANEIMARENYTMFEKAGYVRLGGNAVVIVEVVCVPKGNATVVTVSAFSTDSKTAEAARNEVRTYIATAKDL
jgi:hypothetical protein